MHVALHHGFAGGGREGFPTTRMTLLFAALPGALGTIIVLTLGLALALSCSLCLALALFLHLWG